MNPLSPLWPLLSASALFTWAIVIACWGVLIAVAHDYFSGRGSR